MKKVLYALVCLFSLSSLLADQTTISVNLEATEQALNTGVRTQVFPRPVGVHLGEDYSIKMSQPEITVGTGTVSFSAVISGSYTIGGTPHTFSHTLDRTITFGDTVSTLGIIGILEGVPDEISSWNIPTWVKTIIIDAYEDLELEAYPKAVLVAVNNEIPDYYAVEILDVPVLSWEAVTDTVRFTLGMVIQVDPQSFTCQWRKINNGTVFQFRFVGNVRASIYAAAVYTIMGTMLVSDASPDIEIEPDTWSPVLSLNYGRTIPYQQYSAQFVLGSDHSWKILNWRNYGPSTAWVTMTQE